MYSKRNVDGHDRVDSGGIIGVYAKIKLIGYAVDKIEKQMVAVYGLYCHRDGIERAVGDEVHTLDIVAKLGSEPYHGRTVALMDAEGAVLLAESYHLLPGYWVAHRTTSERWPGKRVKIIGDGLLGLIGHHRLQAVGGGVHAVVGKHMHHVAPPERSLDRRQEAVDTCVFGMIAEILAYLIGEIQAR